MAMEVLFFVFPDWQLVNVNNYENNTGSRGRSRKKLKQALDLPKKSSRKNENNLFFVSPPVVVSFLPISRCRWCCCRCCCVNKLRSFQLCALIAIRHDAFSNTTSGEKQLGLRIRRVCTVPHCCFEQK